MAFRACCSLIVSFGCLPRDKRSKNRETGQQSGSVARISHSKSARSLIASKQSCRFFVCHSPGQLAPGVPLAQLPAGQRGHRAHGDPALHRAVEVDLVRVRGQLVLWEADGQFGDDPGFEPCHERRGPGDHHVGEQLRVDLFRGGRRGCCGGRGGLLGL